MRSNPAQPTDRNSATLADLLRLARQHPIRIITATTAPGERKS